MGRQLRIEFEGAIYHVMARGDRQESIVEDEEDRERFEELWAEAVERSGWQVMAWVLMGNHYHAVIHTPEANLVDGMRWVQNTWTRRYNARHQVWGHLFGGRYKAILCEKGNYLHTLINYAHLNPVRAGLVRQGEGLETYRWSSLRDYVRPERSRRGWIDVAAGLALIGFEDEAKSRRRYLEGLERAIEWGKPREAGKEGSAGQSLNSTLQRGWYFGTEQFREKLMGTLDKLKRSKEGRLRARDGYSQDEMKDHGIGRAQSIIQIGLDYYGLKREDLQSLKKGDERKVAIATLIREKTTVRLEWISEQLYMGATARMSGAINQMRRESRRMAERKKMKELLC